MASFLNNPLFSCFIVVLNSNQLGFLVQDIIPFQFMPNIIRDSKIAIYNDIAIIARSTPVKSYSHSGPRSITFTLEFFAAPEPGLDIIDPVVIKTRVDALRALLYPDYSGFTISPPPRCLIRIGNQLAMIGVCESVNVSYSNQSPWSVMPIVLAHHATIDLTFKEVLNVPLDYNNVRLGVNVGTGELGGGLIGTVAGDILANNGLDGSLQTAATSLASDAGDAIFNALPGGI